MTIDTTSSATTSSADALAALNTQLNAKGGQTTLGADDFMKLLTVQLQSQDPLKPMEDTAFVSQMASFTSLEQMRTLTNDFAAFTKDAQVTAAQAYLGKQVVVNDPTLGPVSGQVTAVTVSGDSPQLVVNGMGYDLTALTAVQLNPPAGTSNTANP